MDILQYLREVSQLPGPSGSEEPVSKYIKTLFEPYCDEVYIDSMYNVIAHKKGKGPKIMLAAHLDEIALMVSRIEEDGAIRLKNIGGVDARILPGMQVWVHGKEKLFGTIGAKPPHLLSESDRKKNYPREKLFADLGLPYSTIIELVQIGDLITFNTPLTELKNNRIACKSMDDRACVGILLLAAEALQKMHGDADIYFIASSQEEVGSRGAQAAAFSINPDLAIALDVCHANIPGSKPDTSSEIDSLVMSIGPFLQPKLTKRLKDTAKYHHVALQTDVSPSYTWTDCDEIQVSRAGIPSILLSLPLRYMHTTVETIDISALQEGGRLLAHFLSELDASWEEDLWN